MEELKEILRKEGFNIEQTFPVHSSKVGDCIGCEDENGKLAYFSELEQGIVHWSGSKLIKKYLTEEGFDQLYSLRPEIPEGISADTLLEDLITSSMEPVTLDSLHANPEPTLKIFGKKQNGDLYYVSAKELKMMYYTKEQNSPEHRFFNVRISKYKWDISPKFGQVFPEYSIAPESRSLSVAD